MNFGSYPLPRPTVDLESTGETGQQLREKHDEGSKISSHRTSLLVFLGLDFRLLVLVQAPRFVGRAPRHVGGEASGQLIRVADDHTC